MQQRSHVPFAEALLILARSVADGQMTLDLGTYRVVEALRSIRQSSPSPGDRDDARARAALLLPYELGVAPVLYQFSETLLDMAVSLSVARHRPSPDGSPRHAVTVTPVDAGYAGAYRFGCRQSSRLRFRLVASPPPVGLADALPVAKAISGDEEKR